MPGTLNFLSSLCVWWFEDGYGITVVYDSGGSIVIWLDASGFTARKERDDEANLRVVGPLDGRDLFPMNVSKSTMLLVALRDRVEVSPRSDVWLDVREWAGPGMRLCCGAG